MHVEKSPIADIETLFRNGMCDRSGCVVAICICKESVESTLDSHQLVRYLMTHNGAKNGYSVIPHTQRFDYEGMFTEIFHVSDADHVMPIIDIDALLRSSNVFAEDDV